MAYVTGITTRCRHLRCSQVATHRVHAEWGDPIGDYCKRHADQAQQHQQASEDATRKAPA